MMKRVYFNELTLMPSPEQNRLWLVEFFKTLKALNQKSGKKVKRIYAEAAVLNDLIESLSGVEDNNLLNEFSAYLTGIYSPNDEGVDKNIKDQYFGVEYSIGLNGGEKPCPTLGWAYLNDSITLGFASGKKWISSATHPIVETSLDGESRIVDEVVCVVNERQLEHDYVKTWLGVNFTKEIHGVELPPPCDMEPSCKKIHYRDDHGREILDAFAQQLVRSRYVVEVVNSIEWDSHCAQFIAGVRPDGIIYVRLHWEDKGYGLAVKTTARGVPQGLRVAEELRKMFDRKS